MYKSYLGIYSALLVTLSCLLTCFSIGQEKSASQNKQESKYLSDSDAAYSLLEKLQREAYSNKDDVRHVGPPSTQELLQINEIESGITKTPTDTCSADLKKARAAYEEFSKQSTLRVSEEFKNIKMPTRFENPQWYSVVSKLSHRIERYVSEDTLLPKGRVVFGTLPTRSVDACIYKVPGTSDRLAVFNEDLFYATYQLTKVLIQTFQWGEQRTSYKREYVKKRVSDDDIRRRFLEVIHWYVVKRSRLPEYYPLEPGQIKMAITLTRSMEMFAIAHEYAHLILNHAPQDMESQAYSWQQEIQADVLGFKMMINTQNKSGDEVEKAYGFWGAFLMLSVMDMLDCAITISTTGIMPPAPMKDSTEVQMLKAAFAFLKGDTSSETKKTVSISHPPFWLRALLIRQTMHSVVNINKIMNDEWDFGIALNIAGHALLVNAAPLLKPK
jgi:hypothetical protein